MRNFPLSPGQKRLREVVRSLIDQYYEAKHKDDNLTSFESEEWYFGSRKKSLEVFYENVVRKAFSKEPAICNDPITGQIIKPLGKTKQTYEWVKELCKTTFWANEKDSEVSYGRYIHYRNDHNFKDQPAYWGGVNYGETFTNLFHLATDNGKFYDYNLFAIYYRPIQVLVIEGDGNHRLLAQVLWGEHPIRGSDGKGLKVYDYKKSNTFNPTLEFWEEKFGGYFVSSAKSREQLKKEQTIMDTVRTSYTNHEIETVRHLIQTENRFGITPTEIAHLVEKLRRGTGISP